MSFIRWSNCIEVEANASSVQIGSTSTNDSYGISTAANDPHENLPARNLTEWPLLRDGDGNRDVHHLHVALQRKGYECHSDDTQWWQYGDSTFRAVQVFQVRANLSPDRIIWCYHPMDHLMWMHKCK